MTTASKTPEILYFNRMTGKTETELVYGDKFIKFIYRRSKSGRMLFLLPFILNKFIYFGLLSHFNSNIYLRDPAKFNDFYSSKLRKSKFILYNKI